MSNEAITHKHELCLSQSRFSISNSRTKYSDSCTVRDAFTKGDMEITQWVCGLFSKLDRIAKDASAMTDMNQPLLGGEHYLTDRELSQRLKISRCKIIATMAFCCIANWVGKSSIAKAILNEFCKNSARELNLSLLISLPMSAAYFRGLPQSFHCGNPYFIPYKV